jgi:hypothetical protein
VIRSDYSPGLSNIDIALSQMSSKEEKKLETYDLLFERFLDLRISLADKEEVVLFEIHWSEYIRV